VYLQCLNHKIPSSFTAEYAFCLVYRPRNLNVLLSDILVQRPHPNVFINIMSPLDTSRIARSTKPVKWLCSVECDSLAPGHCRVKTYRYIENLSVRGEVDQHEQEGGRGVKGNWQHVSPLQPQGSLQESLHDGRFLEVFTKPPPNEIRNWV